MCKIWDRIRIWIDIKMESQNRIQNVIKVMRNHNTAIENGAL